MRVFVAGATGILGRRIVRLLASRGHAVAGLVRDDAGESLVRSMGGEPRRADLFDEASMVRAVAGSEVVVHAATRIPAKVRTSPADWAMNDRLRREGTTVLATAAARASARGYVQQSVVWAVRGPHREVFDETAPPVSNPILASALDGERIAREAASAKGVEVAVLRCGVFYSADGWHTRMFGESILRGRPVLVGDGSAVWSFLHADDAASAFVAACEAPRSGIWHVTDDRPVPLSMFLGTLARDLGARPPRHVPRWLARLIVGRYGAELLTSSFATTNRRFREAFSWRPRYPTCGEGLEQVIHEWNAEGYLSTRA